MGLPMNITRGNPIPVDSTEIWYSLEEAQEYALNGKTSYVGQTIKVVDEATGKIDTYVIGTDGSLIPTTSPNINDNESGEFAIADEAGNVIMKVDSDGLSTTNINTKTLKLDGEDLGELKGTVTDNTSRISSLESRLFVGTEKEFEAAYAAGKIAIGAIVILIDEEISGGDNPGGDEPGGDEPGGDEPGGDNTEGDPTSSKLGTGVLGYMILG